MGRKKGIVTVLLAMLLALGSAVPRAYGWAPQETDGAGTALKYVACAGSIVFMVWVPASVFYTAIVCMNAFITED